MEDHLALQKGVEVLLARAGVRVVGSARDAEAGYELIRRRRPDVAVIDIALPGDDGIALTRRLLAEDPQLRIVLYTGVDDPRRLVEALDSGAAGFAMKAGSPEELVRAIRAVSAGGTYVDPDLRPLVSGDVAATPTAALSPREAEILGYLADGLTGEEVAGRLHLSPQTVRTHVRNAMAKLGARTRVQAIALALRRGEITSSSARD